MDSFKTVVCESESSQQNDMPKIGIFVQQHQNAAKQQPFPRIPSGEYSKFMAKSEIVAKSSSVRNIK
jgi:hypothetical protein